MSVVVTDLPADKLAEALAGAGVPAEVAHALANADADLGLGPSELYTKSGDLRRLVGRPTISLAGAVADALR